MNELRPSVHCWLHALGWLLCLCLEVQGQEFDLGKSDISYRRVFVPEKDLGVVDLKGFSRLEVHELQELLQRHASSNAGGSPELGFGSIATSRLLESHYVARLDGQDLHSERSRLVVSKSLDSTEKVTLRPWTIAVNPRSLPGIAPPPLTDAPLRNDLNTLNWTYDGQGSPRIPAFDPDDRGYASEEGFSNEVVHWFGWSARSDANRQPNKLKFSFSIPKCANSFLLLALPPQAIVLDSATVVVKVNEWADVAPRLKDWNEIAKRSLIKFDPARAPDSLWLIELGASEQVSFSISLGNNRQSDATSEQDAYRYAHLIKNQRLDHVLDDYEIRTQCDAEILVPQNPQQPLRFNLAPGSRLRRLTVNQQEVEWQVMDGWIQCDASRKEMNASSDSSSERPAAFNAGTNWVKLSAEIVTPIVLQKQNLIETPRIAFDRGYVMAGSTVVHASDTWLLSHVECESCRVVDALGTVKSSKVTPLEFSWHGNPPVHKVGLSPVVTSQRCESLTRFSQEDGGTFATIRTRYHFLDQDSNHVHFQLSPGWTLVSAQALDKSDPASLRSLSKSTETGEQFQLSWERIQRGRVAEWEFVLFKNAIDKEQTDGTRTISTPPMLMEPTWKQEQTVVMEDSSRFRPRIDEDFLEHLVVSQDLLDWQQNFLPRSNNFYVLRGFGNLNDPKHLTWTRVAEQLSSKVTTTVHRLTNNSISTTHEMEITRSSKSTDSLEIELSYPQARWRLLEEDHWISLQPVKRASAESETVSSRWYFELPASANKTILQAIVETQFSNTNEENIGIPRVLNTTTESIHVRSDSSEVLIQDASGEANWIVDEHGYKTLVLDPESETAAIHAKILAPPNTRMIAGLKIQMDVAVDAYGSQKSSLELSSPNSFVGVLAIEIENGWTPIAVNQRVNAQWSPVTFQIDGRRLLISESERIESNTIVQDVYDERISYQIELSGPKLMGSSPSVSGILVSEHLIFHWPAFSINQPWASWHNRLWLPKELSVPKFKASEGPVELGRNLLFFDARKSVPSTTNSKVQLPRLLVPKWLSSSWHLEKEIRRSSDNSNVDLEPLIITRGDTLHAFSICWIAIFALLTPQLISIRRHVAFVLAMVLSIISHLNLLGLSAHAIPPLIGMFVGFFIYLLYRIIVLRHHHDENIPNSHSTRWTPWNDRNSNSNVDLPVSKVEQIGSAKSFFPVTLLIVLVMGSHCLDHSAIEPPRAIAQETDVSQEKELQVIIPMDEQGRLSGDHVFVSNGLQRILTSEATNYSGTESGTFALAAKHILRLRSRGRTFSAADEILMSYEFLVGEDLNPVRFPNNRTQLQSIRFSVDGIEISLGSRTLRLDSKNDEWVWTPDKPGKRTVQIVGQPVIRSYSESAKESNPQPSQQLEVNVVPVGNAYLEIDSDVSNSLDIFSRGRVLDPTPGKNLAMLGSVDRIQCKIFSTSDSSGLSNPVAIGNGEPPLLHTELFIQNEILQAKTIIDFPKNVQISRKIEIEADQQWTPVGTQWGDAQWVELLPGSTLSRRRYVLEWKLPNTSSVSIQRDRQISVVWIPQPASENLNIPFAECRDRRVRMGTLRYSPPGANWSIEGINTWIPAIGSKGRLDWPELSSNPIATTLRIPANGSFGILKPKPTAERQQARVTTKWTLEGERESIASRIELMGGNSSSEPISIDLHDSFSVTDVYNRNGPIRFLQSPSDGRNHVQLLADRKLLETSDLWIQAKRELTPESQLGRVPWLSLPPKYSFDQTLEIFASEQIGLRFEHTAGNLQIGKGLFQPVLSLVKEAHENRELASTATQYQVVRRRNSVSGEILLSSNSSTKEFLIQAKLNQNESDKPYFILQVPALLKDRWLSDGRIQSIASPDPNHAWIRVYVPETSPNRFHLKFSQPSEVPFDELDLLSRIKPITSNRISTFLLANPDVSSSASNEWSRVSDQVRETLIDEFALDTRVSILEPRNQFAPAVERQVTTNGTNHHLQQSFHKVVQDVGWMDSNEQAIHLDSRYLFQTAAKATHSSRLVLEWLVEDSLTARTLMIDGHQVPFAQIGNRIQCDYVPTSNCVDVLLRTTYTSPAISGSSKSLIVPILQGYGNAQNLVLGNPFAVEVGEARGSLEPTFDSSALESISTTWLHAFYDSLKLGDDGSKRVEFGSDRDKWLRHWNQLTFQLLKSWGAKSTYAQNDSYGHAVGIWHEIQQNYAHADWTRASLIDIEQDDKEESLDSMNSNPDPSPRAFSSSKETWVSLGALLALLVAMEHFGSRFSNFWKERPWWSLLAMGGLAWCITGSMIPALVLGIIGFVVMIDYFQLANERLRRTGLHGPRSL